MRANLIVIFYFLFNYAFLFAENISIESKNIILDKNKEISIFKDKVIITTENNHIIKADYAEYNKSTGFIKLRNNILVVDNKNNQMKTEYAEYDEKKKIFKSIGPTQVRTTENYIINGEDIIFDNSINFIKSKKNAIILDEDNNKIYLDNFEYQTKKNIFKSVGYIKIQDKNNNSYEFSQIYIDTKIKEIIGSDIKAFLNNENFKINEKNNPRIFANTLKINNKKSKFNKSVFTLCEHRKNDKCPPWSIQSTEMLHDNIKKTIYYENAIIKVYDIPIFYLPKLSHPDPSVERRSGFLPPSISDSKNLGSGLTVPYFWAVSNDKNFTIKNKLFASENPLFLGEYHQVFKNSNFLADFGYTEGYKKSNSKKKLGAKSHLFSEFVKNFSKTSNSESKLKLTVQNISDDKYLKLYKIKSNLIGDYSTTTLENSLDFTHEEEDFFINFNASVFETLNNDSNDKYEYILPEVTFDKSLLSSNKIGNINLQSSYKSHIYDTNKSSNFLVNDFNWNFKDLKHKSGLNSKIFSQLKNINYETKNIDIYKKQTTSELHGALGYLTELNLTKQNGDSQHWFKPKILFRYSPGSMRQEESGSKLDPINAFSLNRLSNKNNFETGLSSTIGFDYNIKNRNKEFDFSVAQIINEKENKKMPSKTSLDEKLSDLVGSSTYKLNNKIDLNYNFSLDQNYKEFNYNEIGAVINFDLMNFDFNYLEENKHIGDQKYLKSKINYERNDNGIFSLETKRNLITNSAEFYNLSYEYLNDCLRAGIVYRREFYTDSELEPENSLMFKITLTPFGSIDTPSFGK